MDVTIIGCGYVGLVTGVCLASIGHTVRGVEKDPRKLKALQDGHCPIFEPGLQELMQENYASGQIQFTDNVKAAVKENRNPAIAKPVEANRSAAGPHAHFGRVGTIAIGMNV